MAGKVAGIDVHKKVLMVVVIDAEAPTANMFGAAERWLGINDPVLLAELPEEVAESAK
jgi:hypothetical protein